MFDVEQQQQYAAECVAEAERLTQAEDWPQALALRQRAVLHYTEAHRVAEEQQGASAGLTRNRAGACRQYGEALSQASRHPEAAVMFQEAADLYGLLSGASDRQAAQDCARHALASVAALHARPQDRLYLLTARYERQRQQLAMQPDTWERQGDCCLHIAQIFLRRERGEEAYVRYQEALELYERAGQTEAVRLSEAECHHRMGNLLANVLIDAPDRVSRAMAHYERALALYEADEAARQDAQEGRLLCAHALHDLKRRVAIAD